ncbi:hypothetical protein KLVA111870_02015 [Klebsiella variicola]|uniref:hypothetical protein n=1 Tax=Klebsiella variicola TaxID=244366 RepID=UPI00109BB32B|nr:hypothetical protein [Klebsiella variicola]VGP71451.1 hypothetical protein SB5387_01049 [Klebsiella variicola]
MKPVTVKTVKERIARIEASEEVMKPSGLGLTAQHQFELSCLRELLTQLESRTVTVKLSKDHVDEADFFGWGVVVVPLEAIKKACVDAGVTVEIK